MKSTSDTLHLISTIFLALGFILIGSGGWLLGTDTGEGGANIGAGLLMLLGTPLGLVGLALAIASMVTSRIARKRAERKAAQD